MVSGNMMSVMIFSLGQKHGSHGFPDECQFVFINAITGTGAFHFAKDQARLLENFEMLAYSGLSQGENLHNPAANATVFFEEVFKDFYPCRMAQGLAQARKLVRIRHDFPKMYCLFPSHR